MTVSSTSSLSSTYVDLYARNYKDIDEKCLEKFLEDFEDEKKYFVSAFKTARALSLIGLIFAIVLFIYILTTCSCCCNVTYHGIAIVVPIYGLVANIIVIGITNKAKIKYKCQKEGLSSDVDEIIDDQYGSNTVNIVMSVLNIVGYSIVLMFTLCLKFMRNKGIVGGVSMPTPVVPVYPGAYPTPGYVAPYAPNIAYQNVNIVYILIIIIIILLTYLVLDFSNHVKVMLKRIKKNKKIHLTKEEKIKYIDQLTSLKNRAYLNSRIESWDESEVYPQGIIIIDLNNVSYINDNYGREEGDKVITEAANILIQHQLQNSEIITKVHSKS